MTAVWRGAINGFTRQCSRLLNGQINVPILQQSCHISGKTMRGGPRTPVKPYDYVNKTYSAFNVLFDKTTHRFDDNSKIIVVDGPIAAGKSKFAQELANELEMLYIPEANMDMIFINPYGYDMRQLDPKLPKDVRSFDVKNFLADPNGRNAAVYQIRMYLLRYSQYIDALIHVLSTGQGVVLDRCCYSDFVFIDAMCKSGYVSDLARSAYYDIRANSITELKKPHLVVYLDIPVEEVKKRVKQRNVSYEVNSKALTDKYLNDMDTAYKNYLKTISESSELLVYDWSSGGDTEIVVEDIERIDFDRFDKHDLKLKDWRIPKEWDWCAARILYSNKPQLMNYMNVPRFDVPELVMSGEDNKIWVETWFSAPGMTYANGYNKDMGDKGILFKTTGDYRNCT